MKSDWGKRYMAVVFSEMESFLNDLAGASLSAEHEKRRVILEQKILTVKMISPSSSPLPSPILQDIVNENQTEENQQVISAPMRPRSWSYPSIIECTIAQESKECEHLNEIMEIEMKQDEMPILKTEQITLKEKDEDLSEGLYNKKKFERLRQAYLETLKVSRRRSASEPQVRTSSNHRKPNPEYIHGINTGNAFTFEAKNDAELLRKPNKKGFNVVWDVPNTDICG